MNDDRIRQICKDRLAMWTDDLVGDHSTPVLLLGVGHDDKEGIITICTVEDMDLERIIVFLCMAVDRLLEQRVKS